MFFLKLYYKFLDWEWYTNANCMRLFIHCLLKANVKTKKWQGYTIKRGSFITSLAHLSKELKLSMQQIRTAISKLELTKEITKIQQGSNTLIIVNNYNEYQPSNKENNNEITNEQQTNNKQITTTKECKNVYNDKNDRVYINAPNPNNIFNPIVKEFNQQIKEVLNHPARLSCTQCDKVIELNQRIDDFKNTIPTVLQRLKTIQWQFDDGTYRSADVNWLLKDENYVSVLVGAYSTKEELIKNWKPKGIDNER